MKCGETTGGRREREQDEKEVRERRCLPVPVGRASVPAGRSAAGPAVRGRPLLLVLAMAVAIGGCAAPPAVEGLLLTAEQVMEEEQRSLEVDADRASQWLAQQHASLEAGFEADVAEREALEAAWVKRGVRVYVEARKALARHEAELAAAYDARRRNLALAADAVGRARAMLATQDELLHRVPDVRRWMHEGHERYQDQQQQEEGR